MELEWTVIERRQPKLTRKGKAYELTEPKRERKLLKREIQSQIANIGTLMGFDKNLDLVGEESVKLNEMVWRIEIVCRRKTLFERETLLHDFWQCFI